MELSGKEGHLWGQRHLAKVARHRGPSATQTHQPGPVTTQTQATTTIDDSKPEQTPRSGPKASFQVRSPKIIWKCPICDVELEALGLLPHQRSESHLEKAAASSSKSAIKTTSGFWECNVCSTSMNVRHREGHLGSEMHAHMLALDLGAGGFGGGGGGGEGGETRMKKRGGGGRGHGGGGGGGGGGGRKGGGGGGRRRRQTYHGIDIIVGSEAEAMLDELREWGGGRIPGGGGCGSGDDWGF
ncbi:hypothetical protein PQX77_010080 [Marasmius sp. AFHP31]|nr:hypothetical protein PQX77_010080 [Marasmius sp. AFHP31]